MALGAKVHTRHSINDTPFLTDQGNLVLDADFGPIMNQVGLATKLAQRSGIVAHGLFLGLADEVIVGEEGRVQHLYRPT